MLFGRQVSIRNFRTFTILFLILIYKKMGSAHSLDALFIATKISFKPVSYQPCGSRYTPLYDSKFLGFLHQSCSLVYNSPRLPYDIKVTCCKNCQFAQNDHCYNVEHQYIFGVCMHTSIAKNNYGMYVPVYEMIDNFTCMGVSLSQGCYNGS